MATAESDTWHVDSDDVAAHGVPRAMAIGVTLVSALVFYVLATHGSWRPAYEQLQPGFADHFFLAQARALVHGHLYVAPDDLPQECFVYHSRCYGYFGLTPSLLRVPFLPLLHHANRSYTAVYLTLALTLSVGAAVAIASRLLAQVRRTPLVTYLVAAVVLSLGPAGLLVTLGRPAVYEEAIAWSVAFALLGVYSYLRWWSGHRRHWAVLLVVSLVLSTNARPTTLPLGAALGAGIAVGALLKRREAGRTIGLLLFAAVVAVLPIATCLGAYWLKFHTAVPSLLLNQQIGGPTASPVWLAIRRLNHDHLDGVRFVPAAVLAYLRPDGIAFTPAFPFVDFRLGLTVPIGYLGVPRGSIYVAPFAPLSDAMPLIVVTVIAGLAYGLRQIRRRGVALLTAVTGLLRSPLTYCTLGTAASCGVMLSSGFVTNRYLADLFPLVALALVICTRFLAPPIGRLSGRPAIAVAGAVTLLVAWAVWVNLGLEYQTWWHTVV